MSSRPRSTTRILLFSPPLPERTYPGRPPIYYLSSVLRRAGYRVVTLDVDIVGVDRFVAELKSFQPAIVAGTALSIQINDAMRLFRMAKAHCKNAVTILGGNHATAAAAYIYPIHSAYLDAFVVGEGLTPILRVADLVEHRRWSSKRTDVPGLVSWDGSRVIRGPQPLPEFPDRYAPDMPYHPRYDFEIFAHENGTPRRTFQMMTAFGCQNACFFCFASTNLRGETGRKEQRMSLVCVERTLGAAAAAGYEAVYFDDDTFTRERAHAVEVARLCKKYGLVFGCHTRPDSEDDDLIAELVANGCRYMFSGLESAVPEILVGANKTHDPTGYRDAYRRSFHTKNMLGLPVSAFLIHGLPRRVDDAALPTEPGQSHFSWAPDTIEDNIASLEFAVRELDPRFLSMNILRFIPGVPLSESKLFEFLRPLNGPLHGGYFDEAWLRANGAADPRCFHPILRAFEGAGSPIPRHMTPRHCYEILRNAVRIVNTKNRESQRNQTSIVVDPWFRDRFLHERWSGSVLRYELAPFSQIDAVTAVAGGATTYSTRQCDLQPH